MTIIEYNAADYDNQIRIDNKTPVYRCRMNSLSVYQAKIVSALARHGKPVRICELTIIARIPQQNNVSAQVGRLVKKGLLERLPDGTYFIDPKDSDFLLFLQMRDKFRGGELKGNFSEGGI